MLEDFKQRYDVEHLLPAILGLGKIFKRSVQVGELRRLDCRVATLVCLCYCYACGGRVDGGHRRGSRMTSARRGEDAAAAAYVEVCTVCICTPGGIVLKEKLHEIETKWVHEMKEP